MFEQIVSGSQTGVDRAAPDVALELDVPCGGWCPKGRNAQAGLGFYDPFSGLPMLWNPATGQLYSGDVTLDIAVSTSLDMTTASQCRFTTLICTSIRRLGGFHLERAADLIDIRTSAVERVMKGPEVIQRTIDGRVKWGPKPPRAWGFLTPAERSFG